MKLLPSIFYAIEVGGARPLVRLIPLSIVLLGIVFLYNIKIYKGLGDQQSMDNAQLARQIVRKEGFTTGFIRPYALTQVAAYRAKHGMGELFPSSVYTVSTPRLIPDTYNAPGYPLLLAALFKAFHTDFDEPNATTSANHMFAGDRWIPPLNQIFILLTAGLLFLLGLRLFDQRVAWMASVSFLASDFVWKFSLLAIPTTLLMFLVTVVLFGAVEIHRICAERFENDDASTRRAWIILPVIAILLGVICLNWLPLLILLLPLAVYFLAVRGANWFFPIILILVTCLMTAPWFYHWYRACGNPLGSNLTLGLYGQGEYAGDQIYCSSTIPSYNQLFSNVSAKEYAGFLWHFQRGWELLGSNPMILLFAVSVLHEFRRRWVQSFRWLVIGCAFAIIAINNLAVAQPDPVGPWNTLAVMFPSMIMIGSAFFFVLLDRMTTQLPLLTNIIVVTILALTFAPMLLVFTGASYAYYNYPPYIPPYLSYVSKLAEADEWVTTDIPWATAWYGDRPSLWLPESVTEFERINDDVCPSGLMLITPATLGKPMTTLTSGERKEWFPYVLGVGIPETFPLRGYGKLPPGGPEYVLLSNRLHSGAK